MAVDVASGKQKVVNMAIDKVKAYFAEFGREGDVMEFPASSATVELAAQAVGCEPARIAKTLSFAVGDRVAARGVRRAMLASRTEVQGPVRNQTPELPAEEAEERIGHAVGGVCPFAVNEGCDVYLDESLRRFDVVYPACGSSNSAIALTLDELARTPLAAFGSTSASCRSRVRRIRLQWPRRLAKPFPQCERRRFERFRRWAWLDASLAERARIQLPVRVFLIRAFHALCPGELVV